MKTNRGFRPHLLVLPALLATSAGAFLILMTAFQSQPPGASLDARIQNLLSQLTMEEKVSMVHAKSTFASAGVPRLGIPDLWMDDGPMGVRAEVGEGFRNLNQSNDFATAMPASLGLAATFNTNLAFEDGAVIGQEARQRGKNIMLGPSLNIQRTPLCGRNFEYMGEDPFLTSRMAVGFIKGEQAQGVASCAKHFAANSQENQRSSINVLMDERTLREIYLPAFRAAVQEGGALSVMGAYNLFRGQHCCENDYLLNQVLKKDWGFKGLVMSDWSGVHNTDLAATNGMDLEMGSRPPYDTANYLSAPYLAKLKSGDLPVSSLDDKVRRQLYVRFQLGMIYDPAAPAPIVVASNNPLSTPAHQETARRVAEESIVLLKNDGLLPLDSSKFKSVAVIGVNAVAKFALGGGAAQIKAPYEVTALDGISNRLGAGVQITYSPGYSAGGSRGGRGGRGGGRGGAPATNVSANTNAPAEAAAPVTPPVDAAAEAAVVAAKAADLVIFVGGLNHGLDQEGSDRPDMKLPGGQDALLEKILAANPKTVVVFNGGGAVEMGPWLAKAPALLYAWYGGLEGGNALAHVLFGDVDASGRLPCTFPKQLADSPAHALNAYPGANREVTYTEGLLVGYRWFDAKQIEPLFPFGYGLSYTKFAFANPRVVPGTDPTNPSATVEFDLTNTGQRAGAAVPQVYVQQVSPSLPRPPKELKGFSKVTLQPGQTQRVSIRLDRNAFAFYDPDKKGWVAEKGEYRILVGSSSRDVRGVGVYQLTQTVFEPDGTLAGK
jgi:beta-glucosidase